MATICGFARMRKKVTANAEAADNKWQISTKTVILYWLRKIYFHSGEYNNFLLYKLYWQSLFWDTPSNKGFNTVSKVYNEGNVRGYLWDTIIMSRILVTQKIW